jgi:hypothetical protein
MGNTLVISQDEKELDERKGVRTGRGVIKGRKKKSQRA